MRNIKTIFAVALIATAAFLSSGAIADDHRMNGRGTGPVVYVVSQGLYYDSIVLTGLPRHGDFQALIPLMPGLLETEFGPGDPGYLGGRWWLDANMNGFMDDADMYFMCPLLGPGRIDP